MLAWLHQYQRAVGIGLTVSPLALLGIAVVLRPGVVEGAAGFATATDMTIGSEPVQIEVELAPANP